MRRGEARAESRARKLFLFFCGNLLLGIRPDGLFSLERFARPPKCVLAGGPTACCAAAVCVWAGCATQDLVRGQAPAYSPAPGYAAPGYSPPAYSPALQGAPPLVGVPTPDAMPSPPGASASPGQTIVLQVVIEGVRHPEKSVPKLKTRSGEPYDPQIVEDDVKMLLKSRKFVDVSPRVQPVNGGVVVIFQIVERPTIHYIQIVGCENKLKSSLISKTDLKVKDGLDPYAIKEARDKLESYYHDHGYDRVRVTIAEGLSPGDQGVVFLIDEGRKQRIWTTNFIGNKFISGDRLATQIMSNPPVMYSKYLWGGFKGEADRKKIDEDVEKLTSYYRAFGFFQAKIGRFWSFDEQEKWMYLTFVIDEGPQYKVRSISFIGNKTFPTPKLSADLKLHSNDFFNQSAMNKDLGTVRDLYGSYGFVFADIQADPRLLEESAQLDLVYSVKEGSRYRVGQINISITGESPHTSYATILDRLSLRPGDILDTTKLRKDERRLAGSSLYETKDPNKKPKIVFSPPPGMEDATKQLASRPEGRAGWRGGSITLRFQRLRFRRLIDAVRAGSSARRHSVRPLVPAIRPARTAPDLRTTEARRLTTTECRRRRSTSISNASRRGSNRKHSNSNRRKPRRGMDPIPAIDAPATAARRHRDLTFSQPSGRRSKPIQTRNRRDQSSAARSRLTAASRPRRPAQIK